MKITALFFTLITLIYSTGCSYQKLDNRLQTVDKKIIHPDGSHLSSKQLTEHLLQAEVIYLGEIHDNPDHHKVQLELLQALIAAGKKPVIGFEFFSREQTSWLLNYVSGSKSSLRHRKPGNAEKMLRQRLGWQEREDWKYYFPMLALAKKEGLSVFGADIDTGIRSRMSRAGIDNMMSIETTGLPATFASDSSENQKLILQDLQAGHCNMASEEWVQKLYQTMSIRNAFMAQSIQMMRNDSATDQPVVMILGRGHVDYNAGVKVQLHFLDKSIRQLNIGLYENEIVNENSPMNDLNRHDLLILTRQPAKKREDPCQAFLKK